MKFFRAITTATVLLLSGALVVGQANQDQQKEKHGKSEKSQVTQKKRAPTSARERQPQHERVQQTQRPQQQHRTRQQAVAWQQQRGWLRHGGWQGHATWQQSRARRWETEHRTWTQRGGYGGYHIPQATFRLHFGRQHWFRIHSRPTIYMGYPRFSYAGFSFLLVDPWPENWTENWYGTDDVYIDYDDGYYLYDRRYPNVRLAITVVL